MNPRRPSQDSTSSTPRSPMPDRYITAYYGSSSEAGDSPRPSPRFQRIPARVASLGQGNRRQEQADSAEETDWLAEATVALSRDLDTSKKELDIIRFILEELDLRSRSNNHRRSGREGQVELMRACKEYSSSRCHMLRERLRQVQFWAHSKTLGEEVPGRAPEEWHYVDREWRKWLSDQASEHVDRFGVSQLSPIGNAPRPSNHIVWREWGPLPHILSADIWWKDL
ncbi:hypothetical protein F4808DRAFT_465825 [Astrocystis sublimbata]|nr:hypothetical protein F4808DRAFT_465818 [Astrocystis sublimbata]KAI0189892.1 hypothetical protein F4808DRAFT_465825 [Astrocystis sublimbata]